MASITDRHGNRFTTGDLVFVPCRVVFVDPAGPNWQAHVETLEGSPVGMGGPDVLLLKGSQVIKAPAPAAGAPDAAPPGT